MSDSVYWNEYNQVVQCHRDGTIDIEKTEEERKKRGLKPYKQNNYDLNGGDLEDELALS